MAGVAAGVSRYLIPWLYEKARNEKSIGKGLLYTTLVGAAEQLYPQHGSGNAKLAYVKGEITRRGYDVDVSYIESAVYRLKDHEAMPGAGLPDNGDDPVDVRMD